MPYLRISHCLPVPDDILRAAQAQSQTLGMRYFEPDNPFGKEAQFSTVDSFQPLAKAYNTILGWLEWLFDLFSPTSLLQKVVDASPLSQQELTSKHFRIDSLTQPGMYDIEFYYATDEPGKEKVLGRRSLVLLKLDLAIFHGNQARTMVTDRDEATRGALTIVNRNDSDNDGVLDYIDSDEVGSETDMITLDLTLQTGGQLPLSILDGLAASSFSLKVSSGNKRVTFWEDSLKQTPVDDTTFDLPEMIALKFRKTIWMEVTEPSTGLGDIQLDLEFLGGKDTAVATGIWPEIDVREAARHENRVGRNDPRLCQDLSKTDDDCLALNKLLVWHDSQSDESITFEIVKTDVPDETQTLDNKSPLWIQIEEKNHLNMNTWASCNCQFKLLEQDIERYPSLSISSNPHLSYPILIALAAGEQVINLPDSFVRDREDYFIGDFVVVYGIDYDDSKTLAGEEVKGMYEIFGVTTDDFREAQLRYDDIYLKWTVWDLAQSLCYRFSHGEWEAPSNLPGSKDYRPNKDGSCAPGRKNEGGPNDSCVPDYVEQITIDDLTHNLGASFSNHTSVIQYMEDHAGASKYPRQYYNAESVKIPIYEYSPSNDASKLISGSEYFRERVARFLLTKYSFADIDNSYKNAAGQNTRTISMPFTSYSINVEAYKAIGLGWATLNPASSASLTIPFTPGAITFSVTQIDSDTYEIDHDVQVRATVFDRWDYNYFKPGLAHTTLASVSGSSIQSGFDMFTQGPEKPGQVASEIYFIDDNVDLLSGPEVVEIFQLFFYNEKTIRIDRTTGDWFIFIKDVEAKYAKEYLYDENN